MGHFLASLLKGFGVFLSKEERKQKEKHGKEYSVLRTLGIGLLKFIGIIIIILIIMLLILTVVTSN